MKVDIFMRENLMMIWLKALVYTDMQMEASMQAIGTRINSMGSEKKSGMTEASIRVFTKMLRKKVRENIAGLMEIDTLESGGIIC